MEYSSLYNLSSKEIAIDIDIELVQTNKTNGPGSPIRHTLKHNSKQHTPDSQLGVS